MVILSPLSTVVIPSRSHPPSTDTIQPLIATTKQSETGHKSFSYSLILMTSSSISSRAKFVRTTTTIATIFSYSICLLLPPLASTFSPFLLLPSSISSPSSSHERSRFHSTGTEIATSPQHRNTNRNRNTQTNNRSSILTAASTAIMSSANPNNGGRASQNIPTFDGSDEKSKATDFANYFCACECMVHSTI